MTIEELKYLNFFYHPVSFKDKEPPLMVYVPIMDVSGEIIIYRRTEFGYNLRDAEGLNTPCNNKEFQCWLEKVPLFEEHEQKSVLELLEISEKLNGYNREEVYNIAKRAYEFGLEVAACQEMELPRQSFYEWAQENIK